MPIAKAHILAELKRSAAANGGRALGWRRFEAETGIRPPDWQRHWVRFGDAVAEAGLAQNALQEAYTEDHLLGALAALSQQLGHVPVYAEIRQLAREDPSLPNPKTFQRLGSKPQLIAKLHAYATARPALALVARMCESMPMEAPAQEATEPVGKSTVIGAVYLMKSGKFHKIGLSNAVGRRERELAIQLPEPVRVVHTIKTDDPRGIEEYWHRRFADKRKNGEWFQLSADDVAAFRRRKFM